MTVMGYEYEYEYCRLRSSDLELVGAAHMAEDESRTCSSVNEEDAGGASSSKDERWLQLGLGRESAEPSVVPLSRGGGGGGGGLVELDLLSQQQQRLRPLAPIPITTNINQSFMFTNPRTTPTTTSLDFSHQEIPTGYRPFVWNPLVSSSISAPPAAMPMPISMGMSMYYPQLLQYHGTEMAVGVGPSTTGVRVIEAPPRPRSNVWFMLKASQNQSKEPYLPQIPKCYLRIKDGKMTIRLLMKYLANKLRLNSESEVEITCRGQQLPPFFTLQYVRDNVWSSVNVVTLNPDTSNTDHVMILFYGRSAE